MSSIDVILSVFIFIFFLLGFRKGFIATIINLAAFVLFFVLIAFTAPFLKEYVILFSNLSNNTAIIVSYLLIFVLIFILSALLKKIVMKILKALKINWINRLLGGFLGVINALIIITILFLLFNLLPINEKTKRNAIHESQIITWIDALTKDLNVRQISKPDAIDKKIHEIMKNKKTDEQI